ncbi:ATP-binding cassette sub-family G member 1 [Rhipicephalus sanguineus]|uniref:ATP-binding cassette sub-family G member 1 n=1 Tax=Rhipicephalus sanguineus TaxID=34632 RepID=UPI0020C1E71E|nr:ATP-binding cassette sub-family G member 1 [Rhipicephalus sanguineus]
MDSEVILVGKVIKGEKRAFLEERDNLCGKEKDQIENSKVTATTEALIQDTSCPPITLEWKNITFSVKSKTGKRALLTRLYGEASPGTLTAIMGPSGAGKTTLLNILAGHLRRGYEGEVHVNGYLRGVELFNMQSCYVMQDDCLLQELTVREAIAMSMELRTSKIRGENISHLVTKVIEQWGLEECADTLTRSLSGGERKRLAISQELISNSPVILLDEPTSGLDSSSAQRCVTVLKSLAASGRTVLCSIHNPSARLFSQFDNLYMLSGGKCIYSGSVEQLQPFLESHKFHCPLYSSPSDLITEIAFGEHGEQTTKLSRLFIPDDTPVNNEDKPGSLSLTSYGGRIMSDQEKEEMKRQYEVRLGYWKQFKILMKRCSLCVTRNKATCIARLLACLFFAFLLSIMYYDSGNKALQIRETIMMYLVAMMMLLFAYAGANVLTFPLEIHVLLREQRNCWYSPGLYFVSRTLSELPLTIAGPVIMMTIVHWTTSQPMDFKRLAFVILFSIQYASTSESIGYVSSTPFSPEVAVMLCLPAATPSFLFCGFFVRPRHLFPAIRWLTYTSHLYYVHRGIMYALYGNGRGELTCNEWDADVLCVPVEGDAVLDIIDATDVDLLVCSMAVLGIDISLKIFAFALLKWRLQRKQ